MFNKEMTMKTMKTTIRAADFSTASVVARLGKDAYGNMKPVVITYLPAGLDLYPHAIWCETPEDAYGKFAPEVARVSKLMGV
jgi:hypothetical protein